MSTLKGVKTFENSINAWLKENDFGDLHATLGFDFSYLACDNEIRVGLFVPNEVPQIWYNRLKKWGCETIYGDFATALLHEIGHHHTLETCTNFEYLYSMFMKKLIALIPNKFLKNYLYFGLPIEKIATMWAIDFMNENPDKCEKLRLVAMESMNRFFEENECEELVFEELALKDIRET